MVFSRFVRPGCLSHLAAPMAPSRTPRCASCSRYVGEVEGMSSLRRFMHDRLQSDPHSPSRVPALRAPARPHKPRPRPVALDERPQTCAPLNFRARAAEAAGMTPTASLTAPEQRLVFTSPQAARYLGVSLATI